MDITITITYDNNAYNTALEPGWGFSCFITGTEKRILFDTGDNGLPLLRNMEKLGIHPADIDLVFLSHHHSDHVGGLKNLLRENPKVELVIPFSFPKTFTKDLPVSDSSIRKVSQPICIFKNVYSTGELGSEIKEQALLLSTEKGTIIITGCAHPGIVNIVKAAKELLKSEILLVAGGLHLKDMKNTAIKYVIADLKKLGVRSIAPCHCTGKRAVDMLCSIYKENCITMGTGRILSGTLLK
jgi:7,8-dihydropterin-6-yl-methyl-4-(beta-D-ribofuranosyl)aminobenzene 5'-phosphate synthase